MVILYLEIIYSTKGTIHKLWMTICGVVFGPCGWHEMTLFSTTRFRMVMNSLFLLKCTLCFGFMHAKELMLLMLLVFKIIIMLNSWLLLTL
ncbi:Uncharacterized protein TCM_032383 [Theobroma cacao]|uniref:Uncharacterized protein n=1 Tax=Theobroma cacao TaxID=3641 RepID=A0A061FA29_THECC|nr:Uncharacterized protein TCM_032383 [Theobroma cacao]